jgi:hypothetical protein
MRLQREPRTRLERGKKRLKKKSQNCYKHILYSRKSPDRGKKKRNGKTAERGFKEAKRRLKEAE